VTGTPDQGCGQKTPKARRSRRFYESLLSWTHSGFQVHPGPAIAPSRPVWLEWMARYPMRPPLAMGSVYLTPEGLVLVTTPPDPRTGNDVRILDPVDFIHAVTSRIPDDGQPMTRYLGACANRLRAKLRPAAAVFPRPPTSKGHPEDDESSFTASRRNGWARILRKLLDVDPLRCSRCGEEMRIVSVITDPSVADQILDHVRDARGHSFFELRAPSAQGTPAADTPRHPTAPSIAWTGPGPRPPASAENRSPAPIEGFSRTQGLHFGATFHVPEPRPPP
jgi:hypothetical protein